jgi:hypothetical protein
MVNSSLSPETLFGSELLNMDLGNRPHVQRGPDRGMSSSGLWWRTWRERIYNSAGMARLRLTVEIVPQRPLNNLLIAHTLFERKAPQALMLQPRQMECQSRWVGSR